MSHYAIIAGLFAAFGSLFGKLAGSSEKIENTILYFGNKFVTLQWNHVATIYVISIQITFVLLMLLSNACGCTLYGKALQVSKSSLPATIVSTATNYMISALLGLLIFGEATGILWWCGSGLIITGLALIAHTDLGHQKKDL